MRLPTASALERAFLCVGSAVLPRDNNVNEFADRGTSIHAFLEDVNALGRDAALAKIEDAEMRSVCEAIDLERLPVDPTKYAAEIRLAWDVETGQGRELGRGTKEQG